MFTFWADPVLVFKPKLAESKQQAAGSSRTRAVEHSQLHTKVTGKNRLEQSEKLRV